MRLVGAMMAPFRVPRGDLTYDANMHYVRYQFLAIARRSSYNDDCNML